MQRMYEALFISLNSALNFDGNWLTRFVAEMSSHPHNKDPSEQHFQGELLKSCGPSWMPLAFSHIAVFSFHSFLDFLYLHEHLLMSKYAGLEYQTKTRLTYSKLIQPDSHYASFWSLSSTLSLYLQTMNSFSCGFLCWVEEYDSFKWKKKKSLRSWVLSKWGIIDVRVT